jgi:lysyl-tRNA synthetase class 2
MVEGVELALTSPDLLWPSIRQHTSSLLSPHTSLAYSRLTVLRMSRPSFSFLRPYLSASFRPRIQPEHARVYCAIQRRFAQTASAEAYTGPHDVEKQKRLDQLQKAKPLGDYHPRLSHTSGVETLSVRDFAAKYDSIKDTQSDTVSVFGMTG